jgi:hypothetical protein
MSVMKPPTGWRAPVLLAASVLAGCSGSESTSTPTPEPVTVITVSRSGASPRNIVVPRGSQVTFVNEDGRVHEMFSDPHPEHNDCPEFDTVGRLQPGQSRQTANLVIAQTCRFHDHLEPNDNALKGTVTIQ